MQNKNVKWPSSKLFRNVNKDCEFLMFIFIYLFIYFFTLQDNIMDFDNREKHINSVSHYLLLGFDIFFSCLSFY